MLKLTDLIVVTLQGPSAVSSFKFHAPLFTLHASLLSFLVAFSSKCNLKLKHKIIFKILNDNSKYNFKRSAPNPFKSLKSLIRFSLFILLPSGRPRGGFFILLPSPLGEGLGVRLFSPYIPTYV